MGFRINMEALAAELEQFAKEIEDEVEKTMGETSQAARTHINELADQGLHSSKSDYLEALKMEEVSPGLWEITLDSSMAWREDGVSAHDMHDMIGTSKNVKHGKNGDYLIIPFKHNKDPSRQTEKAKAYTDELKLFLKRENNQRAKLGKGAIPYKGFELDADGKTIRQGRLHSFNIPSDRPSSNASHGALSGLTIYQGKDKKTGADRRDFFTFRTMSNAPGPGRDKWRHPGITAANFLGLTEDWTIQVFETEILPKVFEKFGGK